MDDAQFRSLLASAVLRAQVAEHDRLVMFDELALKSEREKIEAGETFDARLGIDTEAQAFFDRDAWREKGYEPEHFVHYEASPESSIESALDAIPFPFEGATYVDLGCGKGRTLVVAARRPFARIVGVELNPDLVAVARANVAKIDPRSRRCAEIEVVECEATTFVPPPGDLVVYMYNPFDDVVLAPVVETFGALSGRDVAIAYNYPKYREVIDRHPAFEVVAEQSNGVVYRLKRGA